MGMLFDCAKNEVFIFSNVLNVNMFSNVLKHNVNNTNAKDRYVLFLQNKFLSSLFLSSYFYDNYHWRYGKAKCRLKSSTHVYRSYDLSCFSKEVIALWISFVERSNELFHKGVFIVASKQRKKKQYFDHML